LNIVLLDADVIIYLHRLNAWDHVLKINQIIISSIILREAYYYDDNSGKRHFIDLESGVGSKFRELSQEAEALGDFLSQFDREIQDGLHSGEAEALSLIQTDKNMLFCTSDKMAIKVLGLMGASAQGISFEKLLRTSGLTKKLEPKHTEKLFKQGLLEGSLLRLQSRKK